MVATVVTLGYVVAFYQVELSSLPADPRTGETLTRAYHLNLLWVPDQVIAGWFGDPPQFQILDRLPLLLTLAFLLAAAFSAGSLALHTTGWAGRLAPLERTIFALGAGLSLFSTYTLLVGLAGGLQSRWLFLIPGVVVVMAEIVRTMLFSKRDFPQSEVAVSHDTSGWHWGWLAVLLPFALIFLLGGLLPPLEFDVREYHLQVPKEWFLAGRINFLPHNIYGNMPLGAEVLAIPAMALLGDWWQGALAGKALISLAALWTALALFAAGRRFFSPGAGIVAALLFLSTPWVGLVSMNGLVEVWWGFYGTLAVFATAISLPKDEQNEISSPAGLLWAGFFAGSALACKYPAAVFVVLPLLVVLGSAGQAGLARRAGVFLLGVALTAGPWLAKNTVLAGNPVYPIAYSFFGGETRTPEKAQQWRQAHRPPNHAAWDLFQRAKAVLLTSPWLGPLLVPWAAVGCLALRHRQGIRLLAGLLAYVFVTWWLFTHRIDRFLVPLLPAVALLAGAGAAWDPSALWRWVTRGLLGFTLLFNFLLLSSGVVADNRYFAGLDQLRHDPDRLDPWHAYLNEHVPDGWHALLVGDAQAFDLRVGTIYNTVFDDCIFEQIVLDRTPEEVLADLKARKISHVYVHWGEIARYRSPGNYGFTDFVQPEIFEQLVATGVLLPPLPPQGTHPGRVYPVNVGE